MADLPDLATTTDLFDKYNALQADMRAAMAELTADLTKRFYAAKALETVAIIGALIALL